MARFGQWSFWLVVAVALAAIIAFSARITGAILRQGVNFWRSWLRSPFDTNAADAEDPATKQKIDEMLNERRAKCSQALSLIFLGIMCFHWTKLPLNFIIYPDLHIGNVTELPGWEAELPLAYYTFLNLVAVSFPRCLNSGRGRQALYYLTMLFVCSIIFMPVSENEIDRRTLSAFLGALTTGGLDLRMRTLLVPISFLLACFISSAILDYDRLDLQIQAVYIYAGCISLVLLVLYLAEALMVTWICREVGAMAGQLQQSAVSSLLDMMCDAVVDLDENARLKAHNAKLAVMLMHGTGRSMQGEELSLFMGDDDSRSRMNAVLKVQEQASSSDRLVIPKASLLSVRMRESMGGRIRVVLYHVPYATLFGKVNHLIGIREEADVGVEGIGLSGRNRGGGGGGETVSVLPSWPAGELRPELASRLQQGAAGLSRQRAPGSLSRSSCSSRSSDGGGAEQPEPMRSIEVYLREGLPIRASSEVLQQELGLEEAREGSPLPLFGQQMTDGGSALLKQLQGMVESAVDSSTEADFVRSLGQWELQPSIRVENVGGSILPDTVIGSPADDAPRTWRSLWVNVFVPVKTDDAGGSYIDIAIGREPGAAVPRRRSGSSQRGTAASSTAQALSAVRRRSDPAAVVTL